MQHGRTYRLTHVFQTQAEQFQIQARHLGAETYRRPVSIHFICSTNQKSIQDSGNSLLGNQVCQ